MTTGEAAAILRKMYDDGKQTQQAYAAIVLFSIMYADDLADLSFAEVVAEAGMKASYGRYKSLGRQLAKFVTVTREFP
jgi:hypothetical protein